MLFHSRINFLKFFDTVLPSSPSLLGPVNLSRSFTVSSELGLQACATPG